ncbi:MAE_28990/MAE_18760 family HEPN-like nuclease [Acetobacter indonesiensis]|uniref:MAE_28990/MAE_18760 family HEPN-like nuclease n=1 Tax=Acetobacter indonesiensis TaxID=104101 RepID=UPI0020A39DB7|nr:MAE_28990/MAE_18760 family HEPN-like nuclease [Acetobacter indonesiensis]MCP1232034.1 HEPN domain-containing protein [Acetobacter indonesiensis]
MNSSLTLPRHNYRARLEVLARKTPLDPEEQADWAKYLSVLISGYIEQSLKEILLEFVSRHETSRLEKYISDTWPDSRNMRISNIESILKCFDSGWSIEFSSWINSKENYKSEINSLISSRNDIAHGKEANTTNVTLRSMRSRLRISLEIIEKIENIINNICECSV